MTVTLRSRSRLWILKMLKFLFKFLRPYYFLTLITDLIHLWLDEKVCTVQSPLSNTHTHTHPPRSCQNQGHGLGIFQKQKMCNINWAILSGDRSCFRNPQKLFSFSEGKLKSIRKQLNSVRSLASLMSYSWCNSNRPDLSLLWAEFI